MCTTTRSIKLAYILGPVGLCRASSLHADRPFCTSPLHQMGRKDRKRINRHADDGDGEQSVRSRKQQRQRPEDRWDGELKEALTIVDAWSEVEDCDLITVYKQLPSILRLRARAFDRAGRSHELPALDRLALALYRGCSHETSAGVRAAAWEAAHMSCMAVDTEEEQSLCDALVACGAHKLACSQICGDDANSISASAISFLQTACEAEGGRGDAAAAVDPTALEALVRICGADPDSNDAAAASTSTPPRRHRVRAAAIELLLVLADPTAGDLEDEEGGEAAVTVDGQGETDVACTLAGLPAWRRCVLALLDDASRALAEEGAAAAADASGTGAGTGARRVAEVYELGCLASALVINVSSNANCSVDLTAEVESAVRILKGTISQAAKAASPARVDGAAGSTAEVTPPPDSALRPCLEAVSNLLVGRGEQGEGDAQDESGSTALPRLHPYDSVVAKYLRAPDLLAALLSALPSYLTSAAASGACGSSGSSGSSSGGGVKSGIGSGKKELEDEEGQEADGGGAVFDRLLQCSGALLTSSLREEVEALAEPAWAAALAACSTKLAALPEAQQGACLELFCLLATRCAPDEAQGEAPVHISASLMSELSSAVVGWSRSMQPRTTPLALSLLGQLLGVARAASTSAADSPAAKIADELAQWIRPAKAPRAFEGLEGLLCAAEAAAALADDFGGSDAAGRATTPVERSELASALKQLRAQLHVQDLPIDEAEEGLERVGQALELIDGALTALRTA